MSKGKQHSIEMENTEKSRKLNLNYFGKIIVGLIAFASSLIAIYEFIIKKNELNISYQIISNVNILEINEQISQLNITYRGSNLIDNNQGLRIITIKITNTGNASILKSFYDNNDPLGAIINGGSIIERPQLIATNSNYIKNNIIIQATNEHNIIFNDVIIEPDDYFVIKVLLLYKKGINPSVIPAGKIAGIKRIAQITSGQQLIEKPSFVQLTFGGGILIQVIRLISYAVVIFTIIFLAIYLGEKLSIWNRKKKRKKLIVDFKSINIVQKNFEVVFFEKFIEGKSNYLQNTLKYINNNQRISDIYLIYNTGNYEKNDNYLISEIEMLKNMIDDGIVIPYENSFVINKNHQETLEKFIDFLKNRNYNFKKDEFNLNLFN